MFIYLLLITQIQSPVLPTINDTLFIDEWWCLGPFSTGVREAIIDADPAIEAVGYEPETLRTYPTILADGGDVKWQKMHSDSGNIKVEYTNVPWDSIQDIYGFVGLLNATYAWAKIDCAEDCRALVSAQSIGSFVLNGRSFPGDAYGDGYFRIPVVLKEGMNTIVLKLSGYGDHDVRFSIEPAAEPLRIVTEDVLLPDFIVGEKTTAYIGVPVMNTTEKRLDQINIEVTGELIKPSSRTLRSLMPLSCSKVPMAIETRDAVGSGDSTKLEITVTGGDFIAQKISWLKIKNKDKSYTCTFLSKIDNSCQYYAVLPPADYSHYSIYSLIMTCHGAGVEARGQVGAYAQKDWAYVVAPTNRRRFGFDWQDWGELDFLEVLDEAKKIHKIDENRIYLTGHSMGGHGVWHIGLSHPDLFAAIAPSAGWTTIQLYAPFTLQKSYWFAQPEQLTYRDMVMREDNPLLYLKNALNLPIYILHGGADDNVPPVQARLMNKYLFKMHKNYVYNEVPGMGHWWDIDSTTGTDCVDLKKMMDFLKKHTRHAQTPKAVKKDFAGPIKHAFFSPFILIYGTAGDPASTENNLHLVRSYAYTWWMRANGFVEVMPDTEVTEEITENYNMILFGNNETNSYVKKINYKLPISIEYNHFRVGEKRLDGDDLCLMEIYPNPLNKKKFVLVYAPASQPAEKFMGLFPVLYSGSGLPDFIIWDETAARFGWAGVVACGFFDRRWRLDRNTMFLKE